ncbi:Thiol:disulfide interchange protein TlpA [Methylocella tundrae]|uniref:Thiol:disulfide interchange protein TlpA n=1 Tax=Methylocella tundrae TaxID=227605 RepID=A0A8B6M8F1_METTU|nr:TlpA disulfide reductase family protein [Methylocella tundrae]VTZ26410.1 Thiol:disulfide interchange protein TlpA [Methylocella tundrae]VTZ51068.1 Thiol:disulfide interchange protein TlpA [Methylocella tundrae]
MSEPVSQRDPDRNVHRPSANRRLVITAGVIAAAVLAVLYAMKGPGGKEVESAACPGARARAAVLAPLAHGEVAAFSVSTQPRPLPELKFAAADGAPARLSDFKGKTTLLNLWATWCVPCRQEMPALDRLQGKLGSRDFTVVAVNIDTAKLDRPKAFLNEIGVKNLSFYADNTADIFQTLKADGKALGLPTTILVDENGCDLGVMAGPAQWDSPDALALLSAAKS